MLSHVPSSLLTCKCHLENLVKTCCCLAPVAHLPSAFGVPQSPAGSCTANSEGCNRRSSVGTLALIRSRPTAMRSSVTTSRAVPRMAALFINPAQEHVQSHKQEDWIQPAAQLQSSSNLSPAQSHLMFVIKYEQRHLASTAAAGGGRAGTQAGCAALGCALQLPAGCAAAGTP